MGLSSLSRAAFRAARSSMAPRRLRSADLHSAQIVDLVDFQLGVELPAVFQDARAPRRW